MKKDYNLEQEEHENGGWTYLTPGIPDEQFCRGDVPLTKEEIRCLTLSRLRLKPNHTVLDVGAGTGTVSIECALMLREGKVMAVEKDEAALKLLEQNIRRFKVDNLEIIRGAAPAALAGVERADRIFIGGTGGQMGPILETAARILPAGGIVVVNCILLESMASCLQCLARLPFSPPQVMSAAISRGRRLGGQTMLQPLNPVFIITAEKEGGS